MVTNSKRKLIAIVVILLSLLLLLSCADRVDIPAEVLKSTEQSGFWMGLFHGFFLPINFIISLFKDSVAIYAVNNSGHLYDLGFIIGACFGFGIVIES